MSSRSTFRYLLVTASLASPALAEVVLLTDGSRVTGEIPDGGGRRLRVLTLDGPRELDRAAIESVLYSDSFESTAAAHAETIAADDAAGWHLAARQLARCGHFSRALDHADRALRAASAAGEDLALHPDLLALPVGSTYRADPLTPDTLAALLLAAAHSVSPARGAIARHRLDSKLAAFGAAVPPPLISALGEGLEHRDPRVRVAAMRAVAVNAPAELAPRVGDRLVLDRDAAVRAAALETARAYGGNQQILARVLRGLDGDERARAAALDVLEALSDTHAVASLVRTLEGGGGPSGHTASMSVTNQVAYVSDFDVEVAQNAVIADPIVSIAQEGAALEVTANGISSPGIRPSERARIGRLLEKLTGARFGADAAAWRAWLAARR